MQPCFYQDLSVEIPLEFQKIVRMAYYFWIGEHRLDTLSSTCRLFVHWRSSYSERLLTMITELTKIELLQRSIGYISSKVLWRCWLGDSDNFIPYLAIITDNKHMRDVWGMLFEIQELSCSLGKHRYTDTQPRWSTKYQAYYRTFKIHNNSINLCWGQNKKAMRKCIRDCDW